MNDMTDGTGRIQQFVSVWTQSAEEVQNTQLQNDYRMRAEGMKDLAAELSRIARSYIADHRVLNQREEADHIVAFCEHIGLALDSYPEVPSTPARARVLEIISEYHAHAKAAMMSGDLDRGVEYANLALGATRVARELGFTDREVDDGINDG